MAEFFAVPQNEEDPFEMTTEHGTRAAPTVHWPIRSRVLGCCLRAAAATGLVSAVGGIAALSSSWFSAPAGESSSSVQGSVLDLSAAEAADLGNTSVIVAENPPEEVFDSMTAMFNASDANGDGLVKVDGVVVTAEQFRQNFRLQRQEKALAKSQEAAVTVTAAIAAREAMEGVAAPDPENVTIDRTYRPAQPHRAIVAELYTFGAPATTRHGIFSAVAPGGCLPGMRIATSSQVMEAGLQQFRVVHDPVASLLDFAYKHAFMDYYDANDASDANSTQKGCWDFVKEQPRLKDTPKWDNGWWLNGHMMYPSVLRETIAASLGSHFISAPADLGLLTSRRLDTSHPDIEMEYSYYQLSHIQKVARSAMMAHLAFLTYYEPQQIVMITEISGKPQGGWNFVAIANAATDEGAASGLIGLTQSQVKSGGAASDLLNTVDSFVDGFGDHMLLFQHTTSLKCVVAIEGSSLIDLPDWLSNLNFFSKNFCGFGPAHRGFRSKLYRMLGGVDYRQTIARKLPSCSEIIVVGHSLGGAQAEMLAGCANQHIDQGTPGYLDSRLFAMGKGEPQRLKSWYDEKAPGYFYKNQGNGWCLDVSGTEATTYRSLVIMFKCELPGARSMMDQSFEFKDGFIISKDPTSDGKFCIDGRNGTFATLWQCDFSAQQGSNHSQEWELMPQGHLEHKDSGNCLMADMSLKHCPYNSQEWHFSEGGKLENNRAKLCLGTLDWTKVPGEPGVFAVLGAVDCDSEHAPRWTLIGSSLRHEELGLCITHLYLDRKAGARPHLSLGDCYDQSVVHWSFNGNGYFLETKTDRCMAVTSHSDMRVVVRSCVHTLKSSGIWSIDSERGFVVNLGYGQHTMYKCIDIFNSWNSSSKLVNGTALFLNFCKLQTDQKWELTEKGFFRQVIGGQKCLSIMNKKHTANSLSPLLWIDNCIDPDDPILYMNLKFERQGPSSLVSKMTQRCVGWVPENYKTAAVDISIGMKSLATHNCDTEGLSASWDFLPDGTIKNLGENECLGYSMDAQEHKHLAMMPCTDDNTQRWNMTEGGFLINRYEGLCAGSLIDASAPEQAVLMLTACPDGGPQIWELTPSGQIKNKATSLCVDSPLEGEAGLQDWYATLHPCDDTRQTQQWLRKPGW
mmetsp:Transcript_16740/g.35957  ORF Transcript_16740/g.35957 Transcript_16740/m.35957 type:complete len:1131 (-) Transcript_16740:160-3552(-)